MSKIKNALQSLWKSLGGAVLAHPAVFAMLCYTCLVAILDTEFDTGIWSRPLVTVPIFSILALSVDYVTGGKPRGLSWIAVVLMALTTLIPGLDDWDSSFGFTVTNFVVLPLIVLIYRKSVSDESFTENAAWTLWSAFLALALASVLALALAGIFYSIKTLFGVEMAHIDEIIVQFCYILVAPMLFIGISERADLPGISRIIDIAVNWILSPAIVIYTAILYAYMGKIIVTWTLPCGGVAIMCLVWGIVMTIIAASQTLLLKHPFSRLVKIHGFLALPLVAMLWVATGRRIAEYGITPSRYFLILCGLMMTVAAAFTLLKVRNGWFKLTVAAAVLFILGLVTPGVNYRSATCSSQLSRARSIASGLGLLGEDGTFLRPDNDSNDPDYEEGCRSICSSLRAIGKADGKARGKIAVAGIEAYEAYASTGYRENIFLYFPEDAQDIDLEEYKRMSFNCILNVSDGPDGRRYFNVGETKVYLDEMMENQMKKIGADENVSENFIQRHKTEILVYERPEFTIFFQNLQMALEENGKCSVNGYALDVKAILFR